MNEGLLLGMFMNGLWQGALAALAIWCVLRAMPEANAARRYAAWYAALALVVVLPVLPLAVTLIPPRPLVVENLQLPGPAVAALPAAEPAPPQTAEVAEARPQPPVAEPWMRLAAGEWVRGVLGVWLAGAVFQLLRLGWGLWCLVRFKRSASAPMPELDERSRQWLARVGTSRRARLLLSDLVTTPVTAGFFSPAILAPARLMELLGEEELDQVGMHEAAHVARRDDWTNLAQKLAEALYWFHPVVWWIGRRLNLERELACDEMVLSAGSEPRAYASCLARLVELRECARVPSVAPGVALGKKQISRRIEMLLDRKRKFLPRPRRLALLAGGIGLAGMMLFFLHRPPVFAVEMAPADSDEQQSREQQEQDVAARRRAVEEARRGAEEARRRIEELRRESEQAVRASSEQMRQAEADLRRAEQEARRKGDQQRREAEREARVRADEARREQQEAMQRAEEERRRSEHELRREQDDMRREQDARRRQDASRTSEGFHSRWSSLWSSQDIELKGQVEFTDDDRDVKSLSGDGRLRIEERRGLSFRRLEVTPNAAGKPLYAYRVDGVEKPFDAQARAWLSSLLPGIIREHAAGAAPRVRRILRQRGAAGVLDEIHEISSDRTKRVYFEELLEAGPLDAEILRRLLRQAGREISSDREKALLLTRFAEPHLRDPGLHVSFVSAAAAISSDSEHRRVVSVLLRHKLNSEAMAAFCRSVAGISSDAEKARILIEAVGTQSVDANSRSAYFRAADSIISDSERRRALSALLKTTGLTRDLVVSVLRSARGISSDHEKAELLMEATLFPGNDASTLAAIVQAADTISSDHERRRVLSALLKTKAGASKESLMETLRSARGLSSDAEKRRLLAEVAQVCPEDDAVVAAYLSTMDTISSQDEQARAWEALAARPEIRKRLPARRT